MKTTASAVEILDRLVGDDAELQKMIEEERRNLNLARLVYDARTAANLTQRELAQRVGTSQSVIARLEDADYGGQSLPMLERIAHALNKRLEIRLVSDADVAVVPMDQSRKTDTGDHNLIAA